MKFLAHYNLVASDIAYLLLEELVEILIERMAERDENGFEEGFIETNFQEKMIEK